MLHQSATVFEICNRQYLTSLNKFLNGMAVRAFLILPLLAIFDTDFINPYAAGVLFGQCKMMQKPKRMTETLANGYSFERTQWELSNEYQHDRV